MEMITIDYTSRLPLYEQIVERFQMLIIKGILRESDAIRAGACRRPCP